MTPAHNVVRWEESQRKFRPRGEAVKAGIKKGGGKYKKEKKK